MGGPDSPEEQAMTRRTRSAMAIAWVVLALTATACASSSKESAEGSTSAPPGSTTNAASGGKLVGLFEITAGSCAGSSVAGSYFRMVQSGGKLATGPFVTNSDSTCATKTYTALTAGRDGGLLTGSYQAQPDPPFDASNNGAANKITEPTKFFAVGFAIATNAKDPQTKADVPAPSIVAGNDGKLTGDLSAVGVSWNGQEFNQGAPKPGGATSANTTGPTGTYDATTGAYTLEWTSQIVGGPFNGFTGVWHLTGTFAAQ